MQSIEFSDEEKIRNFDEIVSHFYNTNFGQMSKTDMELMMFHFYLEKVIYDNKNVDNTIDYSKCSDYKISKELGITQQKVRNLKVKSQLIYPIEFDWKKSLSALIGNARFDKEKKKIILNIPDPNLYYEIREYIEEKGAYVETQLNSKILQIRIEYFIELMLSFENAESKKEIIKYLKKKVKENDKAEDIFDEKEIAKSLIKCGIELISTLNNITSMLSDSNPIGIALKKINLMG